MGNNLKKLAVVSDSSKNRLYFTVAGKITKKEMDAFYTDIRFSVEELKSGFTVISDFSECQFVFLSIIPTFRKIMRYLITNGVGEMIGVMPEKSLFYRQIQLASLFQGYRPMYVSSLEEAEAKLEDTIQRDGLRFIFHRKAVDYITGDVEGKGYILNISTSGCAVKRASTQPSVEAEIKIVIAFTAQNDSQETFTLKARVVRVEETGFAVEFTDFDNSRKEQLWNCFVDESQRDISQDLEENHSGS